MAERLVSQEYPERKNFNYLKLFKARIEDSLDEKEFDVRAFWKIKEQKINNNQDLIDAYDEVKKLAIDEEKRNKHRCTTCAAHPLQSSDPEGSNYYKIPTLDEKKFNFRSTNRGTFSDATAVLMDELANERKRQDMEFREQAKADGLYVPDISPENLEYNPMSWDDYSRKSLIDSLNDIALLNFKCERCNGMMSHGETEKQFKTAAEIMKLIPKEATICVITSMLDFPLGLDKSIVQNRDPKSIFYLFTKGDLFFDKEAEMSRTGLPYVRDVTERIMDADRNKVFIVSSENNWNLKNLYSIIPSGKTYFVGRANAGKSSIIREMLRITELKSKKTKGKTSAKEMHNQFRKLGIESPGVFHIPGFTQAVKSYKSGRLTIRDTPGYFTMDSSIFKHLSQDSRRKTLKYTQTRPSEGRNIMRNIKTSRTKLFNGDAVFTYGGFFYLQPPKNMIMQIHTQFNKTNPNYEATYSSIERAKEINLLRPKEIGDRFALEKESMENMDRYVIPPFLGKIDIVIQDLGFFTIEPTSSPSAVDGLFQIYVPKGMRVIARESIFNFIYRGKKNRDKFGNRLSKRKTQEVGIVYLRELNDEKKLHFTELYPVPLEATNEEAFRMVPCTKTERAPEKGKSQVGYKNLYWKHLNL
ncbi:Gep3 protein [Martiniozyma asiatica (nom. inval.)]|nr:Gep3 protein [Martiniozyma asiatica]